MRGSSSGVKHSPAGVVLLLVLVLAIVPVVAVAVAVAVVAVLEVAAMVAAMVVVAGGQASHITGQFLFTNAPISG